MGFYDNNQFRNAVKDAVMHMYHNGEVRGDGVIEIGSDGTSVGFSINEEELTRIIQETVQPTQVVRQVTEDARFR